MLNAVELVGNVRPAHIHLRLLRDEAAEMISQRREITEFVIKLM